MSNSPDMSHYTLYIIFIFLIVFQTAFAQKNDVVILKNGDRITGEIKYLRVGILNLSTDNMETINIQWSKVNSLSTSNFYEIELQDGRVYFGTIEPTKRDGILLIKSNTLEINLFMKYIVRLNRIKESFWDILDGYVKFGFSFTKASKIGQMNLGGNAKYRTKINLSELILNSSITATETEPTSRKQDLSFSYQHNLRHTWFGAGIISLEENTELGIKLRTSVGVGLGNNFIQLSNQWLYGIGGIMFNREVKVDESEPSFNLEGLISTQYQLFKYEHPKANLLTYLYFLPSFSDFGRYRLNYNIQLSWEIFLDFYWDLTFYFEYDNRPLTENSSSSDYRIDTSIKYEF